MVKIQIPCIVSGLLIHAFLIGFPEVSRADDDILRQRIDAVAKPYLDNHLIMGMSIGVLHNGKQDVFGFGRMSRSDPRVPDGDTIYEIGGITKVLTGILLADAVIEGHVRLDQAAGDLLPLDVSMPSKGDRAVTLLDLSTHVSGLPRIPDNMKFTDLTNPYVNYLEKDLYKFLNSHRLKNAPGTRYSYSNLGQGLLGHLLSLRQKSTYEQLMQSRITLPLGMHSTKVTIDKESQSRFAPGHRGDGQSATNWDLPVLAGAGCARTTVNDMLLFAHANLSPRQDTLGKAIEMAWEIHQTPLRKADPTLGLGWHVMADGTHWHNGQTGGYHSMLLVNREFQLSVVVLTNSALKEVDQLATDIFKLASGEKVSPRSVEKAVDVPDETMRNLAGEYDLPDGAAISVEVTDGKLMVGTAGQQACQVFARSESLWLYRGIDASITFHRNRSGQYESLTLTQNGVRQNAKRRNNMLAENTWPGSWIVALIAMSVILAFAIVQTSEAWFAHRERMAMIEKGIDPDTGQSVRADT